MRHMKQFLKRKGVLIKMLQTAFTGHAQTYYSVNLSSFVLKLQLKVIKCLISMSSNSLVAGMGNFMDLVSQAVKHMIRFN